jgi:hypothetical protein
LPLPAGTRLGPYEIRSALGAGGMGEVYKAHDSRLGRTVAVKVLLDGFAADPVRRHRFEQEARAVSALNHPHICVLHDVGREGDTDFLVLEYLEGQTLAQRLRKGPLPVEQALEYGAQIADALARAHRNGIVHRDLKPANVMLTKDGGVRQGSPQVKLLDFGLAKLRPEPVLAGGASGLSTAGIVGRPGEVVGTLPYMAPEQLEGKETDARTDLFGFGCVLYEMLTGRRAFEGESEASIISAIMSSEPPAVTSLRPLMPPAVERLVKGCLAKNPDVRRQSAHDAAEDLRAMLEESRSPAPGRGTGGKFWRLVVPAALVTALGLAGAAWLSWPQPGPTISRVVLTAPRHRAIHSALALAPDGSGVIYSAYASYGPNNAPLFWHGLNGGDPIQLPGTDGAEAVFICPDGKTIGFGHRGKLVVLPFRSGRVVEAMPEVPLADVGWIRGASCGEDGRILYAPQPNGGLWLVSAAGEAPRQVTRPDAAKGETSHRWPCLLPGGRTALFAVTHGRGNSIDVLSLETGRWTRVIEHGTYPRFLPTGHVVYASNGSLLAVPFDLATLTVKGVPTPVVSRVSMADGQAPVSRNITGLAFFDVSRSGALVFAPDLAFSPRHSLVWLDRDGSVEQLAPEQDDYLPTLALSSDGRKLAVVRPGQGFHNLWVYEIAERRWQQLTVGWNVGMPLWSPAGDRIAVGCGRPGRADLCVVSSDGTGEPVPISSRPVLSERSPSAWSPDGRLLVYQEAEGSGWSTWVVPEDGGRPAWRLEGAGENATLAAVSPDGRWIAYQSNETGQFEVYVMPFPGPGPSRLASGRFGGVGPAWSADGREVMFLTSPLEDRRIMATVVAGNAETPLPPPHLAFAIPFDPHPAVFPYLRRLFAPAPGGRRVAMVQPDPQAPYEIRSLAVLPAWGEEVKATLGGR